MVKHDIGEVRAGPEVYVFTEAKTGRMDEKSLGSRVFSVLIGYFVVFLSRQPQSEFEKQVWSALGEKSRLGHVT